MYKDQKNTKEIILQYISFNFNEGNWVVEVTIKKQNMLNIQN